ncbi:hypothetical protein BH20BAC1_BH20BAC1_05700 [soil metagenome]
MPLFRRTTYAYQFPLAILRNEFFVPEEQLMGSKNENVNFVP